MPVTCKFAGTGTFYAQGRPDEVPRARAEKRASPLDCAGAPG